MRDKIFIFILWTAFISCTNKDNAVTNIAEQEYTCPMPSDSVFSDKPGNCPKCGMELVKVKEHSGHIQSNTSETIDFSINPTDEFAISSIPLITLKDTTLPLTVKAYGTVNYDKNFIGNISSKVTGRIDKLFIKYKYQKVYKGQKILNLYSPELLTEQQNLLFLLGNDNTNTTLIEASKQRLRLLGVTQSEIHDIAIKFKPNPYVSVYADYTGHLHNSGTEMLPTNANSSSSSFMGTSDVTFNNTELNIKEGMYVQKGQAMFTIYNQDNTYALLSIFNADISLIKEGISVELTSESRPNHKIYGKINFIEPFYGSGNKNQTVRVYFNNKSAQLPIGSQVNAIALINPKRSKWVVKTAVINLGLEKIVFKKYHQALIPVKVKTGIQYNNQIEIIDGLAQTDSIAINAQFLMDSESFIKIKK